MTQKNKIRTTEWAIDRIISLGLDILHPIVQKAKSYMEQLLRGDLPWPEYKESNNRWELGEKLFISSTLSFISPDHPMIKPHQNLWRKILEYTFKSGVYDENAEIEYHKQNTRATVKNTYLTLDSRYQVRLIGSGSKPIPIDLEKAYLPWLSKQSIGIGYLETPLLSLPPLFAAGPFDRWLASLELLGSTFPNWSKVYFIALKWLWEQQVSPGIWDFSKRNPYSVVLPFSEDWRKEIRRKQDWTARVLLIFGLIN